MLSQNTKVIEKLWMKISQIDSAKYQKLKDWHTIYFTEHKNRYLSDLVLIEKIYKEGNIVEIGSFPYHLTFCLKELGYPITGIDLNPERDITFISDSGLEIEKCDIETELLPLKDNSANLIIFNETFEHLRINPRHALKELNRILSPNGVIILTTPNLYSLKNIINFNLGKSLNDAYEEFQKLEIMGHVGHIREYSFREMRKFLKTANFKIISHQYVTYKKSKKLVIGNVINFLHFMIKRIRPFQVIICEKY